MFTPEVPGEYTIIASFKGSDSYWSSSAETAIGVKETPTSTTPTVQPLQTSMTDTYVMAFGSAAITAIVIGFVALIMLTRKR
jgi:hypothetical protein